MKDDLEVSTVPTRTMAQLAVVADKLSSAHAFEEYRLRVSENTRDRQEFDLTAFENYLYSRDVAVPEGLSLYLDAKAWRGISYGVVDGFVKWMSNEGESIGTMNVRLSTIKTYVGLAEKCGVVSRETLDSIRDIHGYRHIEGLRLDERGLHFLGHLTAEDRTHLRRLARQFIAEKQKRNSGAPGKRNLSIDEDVFDLFFVCHAKWRNPVSRPEGAHTPGERDLVEIEKGRFSGDRPEVRRCRRQFDRQYSSAGEEVAARTIYKHHFWHLG